METGGLINAASCVYRYIGRGTEAGGSGTLTAEEAVDCVMAYEDYSMVFAHQSNSDWRIRHLHTFVHFYTVCGNSWYDQNIAVSGTGGTEQPAGVGVMADIIASGEVSAASGEAGGIQQGCEDYAITGTYYVGFDLYCVPVLSAIPEPYDTWADIEDTFARGGFQPLLGNNAEHLS